MIRKRKMGEVYMNFEDCKAKIQKISDLIENSKYPEDILNSKEIDFNTEFQYLCLNSSANSDLVNEVIARLAQNGNSELIEQNIKSISIGMWKDLFVKNNTVNDIFINNYDVIMQNAGIITYREIEDFIDNESTLKLIYNSMPYIIRKLCTYDRAALISKLSTKEDGIDYIKQNMANFFKKGEYDISTTYSKILTELSNIPEISKLEILEACNPHFSEMLERETAIDNETNNLLNWIYDSMEETKMFNEQRADLQKNIDNAILDNFDNILDKSNYDKTTIKILKQFPCTFERFENNKNLFIEKSCKLIHMTKIYDFNFEKDNENQIMEDIADINDNVIRLSDNCGHIQAFIEQKGDNEISECVENENCKRIQEAEQKDENKLINELVMSNIKDTDNIINKVLGKEQSDSTNNDNNSSKLTANSLNCNGDETKKIECLESSFDTCHQDEITKKYNVQDLNDNKTGEKIQNQAEDSCTEEVVALAVKENEIGSTKVVSFFKRAWDKIKKIFERFKTDRIGE